MLVVVEICLITQTWYFPFHSQLVYISMQTFRQVSHIVCDNIYHTFILLTNLTFKLFICAFTKDYICQVVVCFISARYKWLLPVVQVVRYTYCSQQTITKGNYTQLDTSSAITEQNWILHSYIWVWLIIAYNLIYVNYKIVMLLEYIIECIKDTAVFSQCPHFWRITFLLL